MSNPLRAPTAYLPADKNTFPDAFINLKDHPKLQEIERAGKDLVAARKKIEHCDMDPFRSVAIPKHLTVIPEVHQKAGDVYATAQAGKLNFRIRSKQAHTVCSQVFRQLPDESEKFGFLTKKAVGDRASVTLSASGGTTLSLNRLAEYYPAKNSVVDNPPTREEALMALQRCGLVLRDKDSDQLKPYPLVFTEGVENMKVNLNSDNGYPVGGKLNDDLARQKVNGLARHIRSEAVAYAKLKGARALVDWKREQEESNPELWLVKGKTKGDYYKVSKLGAGMLRFYNAFPRQVVLNMQVATQVMERQASNISNGTQFHSGLGISLVRGGAEDLVDVMDQQLKLKGYAYVHVGDDSWVAVKVGEEIVLFALDCSSFDLTQHGDATLQVHTAIRDELEKVDAVAANLWFAMARERLVVLVGGAVVRMKHAGPSGMPLQSKVNDVLMDIMIDRTLSRANEATFVSESSLDALLQDVGKGMGFSVRLESYTRLPVRTIKEAIGLQPFLFVGYYFYTEEGQVRVVADLPRSMAQMPYPSQTWVKKDLELELAEAMRLGSIYMSQGIYPEEARAAQNAYKEQALLLIEKAIRNHGDVENVSLRFAVGTGPHGPDAEASLSGLKKALEKPLEELWLAPQELASTSTFISNPGDWYDDLLEEEKVRGADRPLDLTEQTKKLYVRQKAVPTHPPTWENWGRPPPTAVWGPPKAPKQQTYKTVGYTTKGKGHTTRIGKVLPEEDEEEWFDDYDSDYEDMY